MQTTRDGSPSTAATSSTSEHSTTVARFPLTALGGELRVEDEDHTKSPGRRVGANQGRRRRTLRLPALLHSDLFDLGCEAIGELGWRPDTLSDVNKLGANGTIYYRERRPRGIVLWNQFGQVDAARELNRRGRAARPERTRCTSSMSLAVPVRKASELQPREALYEAPGLPTSDLSNELAAAYDGQLGFQQPRLHANRST
jgi:hypothetical protein